MASYICGNGFMFEEVYERMIRNCVRDEETGCLIYQGQTDGKEDPYGRISYRGTTMATHLVSWKRHKGRIPKGYDVDHKCTRRLCVEINHLMAVSKSKNAKLRDKRRRMSKRRGYEYGKSEHVIMCLAVK